MHEYNNLNVTVLLMIFNILYTSAEIIYLPWNSLPSAATWNEQYSQSNVGITEKTIIPFRRHSFPYVPPWKEIVKARNVTLPKNISVSPTPFSKGDGNQRHPEHKKREVSWIQFVQHDRNCGSLALKLILEFFTKLLSFIFCLC